MPHPSTRHLYSSTIDVQQQRAYKIPNWMVIYTRDMTSFAPHFASLKPWSNSQIPMSRTGSKKHRFQHQQSTYRQLKICCQPIPICFLSKHATKPSLKLPFCRSASHCQSKYFTMFDFGNVLIQKIYLKS